MTNTLRKEDHLITERKTRVEWSNAHEVARLTTLVAERKTDEEIAEILSKEFGHTRTKSSVVNKRSIMQLLKNKPRVKAFVKRKKQLKAVINKPLENKNQVENTNDGVKKLYPYVQISVANTKIEDIMSLVSAIEAKGFICSLQLKQPE